MDNYYFSGLQGYDFSEQFDQAVTDFKSGSAIGLDIGLINNSDSSQNSGSHAVSLFGYIKDAVNDGLDYLKALFITDSDDSSTSDPDENRVVMYTLKDYTESVYNKTIESKELMGYSDSNHAVITAVTTLKSAATAKNPDAGTHDAVNDIDLSVTYMAAYVPEVAYLFNPVNTTYAGNTLYLHSYAGNRGYGNLNSVDTDVYVRATYKITSDNEVIDTITFESLIMDGYTPNDFYSSIAFPYTFNDPGKYKISYEVNDIYYLDSSGNEVKISEAYLGNNSYKYDYYIDVYPNENANTVDVVTSAATVPVFTAVFNLSDSGLYSINVNLSYSEIISLVFNNSTIPSDKWSIVDNGDGTVTITFDPTFVKSVLPGEYIIKVLNSSGSLIASLYIKFI